MSEFDEKLNALLSNPESMDQIFQLAQSLSGSQSGGAGAPGGVDGAAPAAPSGGADSAGAHAGGAQPAFAPTGGSAGGTSPLSGGMDFLSSLTGGLDPKLIARLLPLVQELGSGRDSDAAALLRALRPYLKQERQDKVERALQLARLIRIGKQFLAERGGKSDV